MEDNEKVDYEEFSSKIWGNIHSIYKKLVPDEPQQVTPPPVEPQGDTGVPVPTEEPQVKCVTKVTHGYVVHDPHIQFTQKCDFGFQPHFHGSDH